MAATHSFSSSTSSSPWIYDVFLSFRGEDTRKNFTDHLYFASKDAGINTFRDDNELRRGEDISSELRQAIQKSRISVIVFSRNYADSRWCLEELVKIMECRRTMRQKVYPIFYDVDPSDVRKQTGSFAEAFARHEERLVQDEEKMKKVGKWKVALTDAANLSGWDLRNVADGHEAKFIKKIVGEILIELNSTHLFVAIYPVGINSRVQKVKLLLNVESKDVRMVGICGLGGVGKTTLAKAIYNELFHSFEGKSFLGNVRETSQQPNGQVLLQEQLLCDILKVSKIKISSVDRGINVIKERLRNRKVLLILDDVDQLDQLNAIARSRDSFGPGSRIIITTRYEHLLKVLGVDEIYTANEMNGVESLELFCWHAFGISHPIEGYVEVSERIVDYSGGLPLALEVLGSFLFGRKLSEWKDALEKLKRIPHSEIQKKLRISFDALSDDNEKNIFLDISCFFLGMDRDYIVQILNGCDFHAEIGLSVLIQRCLVIVNESNKLTMHDLLRDMGRAIVREESPDEPGRCSRLWYQEDVVGILKKNKGTEAIKGLTLNLPKVNDMNVDANVFCKLQNLRLLQLNYVQLSGSHECLLQELRWLCWHGFPLKFIPYGFYQENLVAIDMQHSNLRRVYKNSKFLGKLKFLNLSHSHYLVQTPDFSKLPYLEELQLEDCKSLVEVHHSIGCLDRLILINFKDCKQLKILPRSFWKLNSLEVLNLSGCSKFDDLPEELGGMESLTTLLADDTGIREVPSTIVRLKKLKHLSLSGCKGSIPSDSWPSFLWSWVSPRKNPVAVNLLPASFQGLNCLGNLCLKDCNLSNVPEDIGSLSSLTNLDLASNTFCSLPTSLSGLSKLTGLKLDYCTNLRTIPNLPRNLDILHATHCASLERLPDVSEPSSLRLLYISNCPKLNEAPGLDKSQSITHVEMEGCNSISNILKYSILKGSFSGVVLPGNEVPGWFNYINNGPSVSFLLPEFSDSELKRFNVCIVCASHIAKLQTKHIRITVTNQTRGCDKSFRYVAINLVNSDEDHLWQGHVPLKDLKVGIGDKVEVTVDCRKTMTVKKTGVYLVFGRDENHGRFVDGKTIEQISRSNEGAIFINDEAVANDELWLKAKSGLNVDDEESNQSEELTTGKNDAMLKATRSLIDEGDIDIYDDNGEVVAKEKAMLEAKRGINVFDGATPNHDVEQLSETFRERGRTFPIKQENEVLALSATNSGWDGGRFLNVNCNCGKRAAVNISESENNKYRLYYSCAGEICGQFLGWAIPASTSINGVEVNEPRKREDDDYTWLKNDLQLSGEENEFVFGKIQGNERGLGYMKDDQVINEVKILREENKLLFSKIDGMQTRVMKMKKVFAACLVCHMLFVIFVLVMPVPKNLRLGETFMDYHQPT